MRSAGPVCFPAFDKRTWDCPCDDSFATPQLDDKELRGFARAAWTSASDRESVWPDSPGARDSFFYDREFAKLLTPARSPSDIMRRGSLFDPEARSTQSPSLGSAILATGSGCSTNGPRFLASGSGGYAMRQAMVTPSFSAAPPSAAAPSSIAGRFGIRDHAAAQLAKPDVHAARPQGVVRTLDFSAEAIPLSPCAPRRPGRRLLDDSPVWRLEGPDKAVAKSQCRWSEAGGHYG